MNFTDQLQDGLDQLRDALEAFAFALKAIPIQRGHLTVPNDEVTGEYLASIPVGLTQANPDKPGVNEKALQDLEDALRATTDMRAGLFAYSISGDAQRLRECLQAADSEN